MTAIESKEKRLTIHTPCIQRFIHVILVMSCNTLLTFIVISVWAIFWTNSAF